MARLKVTEISGSVNTGKVPQLSSLNIPINLANYQAKAIGSIGSSLTQLFADQKSEEDNNEFFDIQNKINLDVLKSFNENGKNTNLEIALENFTNDIDYTNYKDLGTNKAVKKKVKNYLANINRKYSLDLGKEVLKNSADLSKFNKEKHLNKMVNILGGTDATAIAIVDREYDNFWNDPINATFYGPEKLAQKKQEKDELILELQFINGGKRGDIDLLNNEVRNKILAKFNKERGKSIIDNIRKSGISLQLEEEKNIEFRDRQDKDFKINNFTKVLLAINDLRRNPSEETKDKVPDLNAVYDLRQSGAINSAQYNTLLKFMSLKADQEPLSDAAVEDLVNSQLVVAETVEEFDALQESVNLDADIQQGLNPNSIIKLNGLIDKYKKDRTFGREHKYFYNLLKNNTKKVFEPKGPFDISGIIGAAISGGEDYLTLANSIINEFHELIVDKNYTPEQAYEDVIINLDKKNLPQLNDLQQPRSIKIENFKEELAAHPKDAFIGMRDAAAISLKDSGDFQQFKDDLKHIDRIEDVYDVRLKLYDGNVEKALGKDLRIKKKK